MALDKDPGTLAWGDEHQKPSAREADERRREARCSSVPVLRVDVPLTYRDARLCRLS